LIPVTHSRPLARPSRAFADGKFLSPLPKRLKVLLPSVPVIVVTVNQDPDHVFRAFRAGASGYLLKRETPEKVLNAIREARHGGVPMSAVIARKVLKHFQTQAVDTAEVEKLSPREREILALILPGLINKEIADRLGISVESIRWHLKNVYRKLHVHSRTEAASKFRPAPLAVTGGRSVRHTQSILPVRPVGVGGIKNFPSDQQHWRHPGTTARSQHFPIRRKYDHFVDSADRHIVKFHEPGSVGNLDTCWRWFASHFAYAKKCRIF
jgi:DNA-binding CsgD family transcriptional regulator